MSERALEFTAYVTRERRRLVRAAFLLCGNWSQAEDVTQIALAKLYAAWPRVSRRQGPDRYVRKIIARTVIDEWRRPWRREVPTDVVLESVMGAGQIEATDGPDLRTAVLALPIRQRQTVVLRHYWGLSVVETADALGISTGSVKSHCSRGLQRLQDIMRTPAEEATR